MGLNIKNPEAEKAIRDLAAATGESLTKAIEKAARERLVRVRATARPNSVGEFLAKLRPVQDKIAAERAARGDTRTSRELMDELYDEDGLPK